MQDANLFFAVDILRNTSLRSAFPWSRTLGTLPAETTRAPCLACIFTAKLRWIYCAILRCAPLFLGHVRLVRSLRKLLARLVLLVSSPQNCGGYTSQYGVKPVRPLVTYAWCAPCENCLCSLCFFRIDFSFLYFFHPLTILAGCVIITRYHKRSGI